jgi:hypothetical protein
MPTGLALRLGQGLIIGWAAALAIGGLVGGLVAQSVSSAVNGALKRSSRIPETLISGSWPHGRMRPTAYPPAFRS